MRMRPLLLTSLAVVSQLTAQEQPAGNASDPVSAAAAVPTSAPTSEEASPSQVEPDAEETTAADSLLSETDVPPAVPVVATAAKGKDTLSVDFPDEEIRTILRNVADLFELNLVVPDTLQGRTSLKLREVTWRQIYNVVLSPIGYTFVEDGNIIKIVSQDSLMAEPVSTEVFFINNARADDVRKSVESIIDGSVGGKVVVDARSNALVITERPSRLGRIRPLIERLDMATSQVMIESKFIEVNNTNTKNLGVNWSSLNAYAPGITPVDTLLLNELDDVTAIGTNTGGTAELVDPTTAGTAFGAVLTGPQFSATLSALQRDDGSRIVSNPTIVTLNNTSADINVGEEYPIPSYTYNAEQGQFEVSGFEYKPIGVLLRVTPQVNSQGFIRLALEPEISVRGEPVVFGGASGAEIPIIRTRKTKTQVSLKDGHTLAIGGLIDSTDAKITSKVPVLGGLPGIGRLFRHQSDTLTNRNLLIFITAKVISAEAAQVEEVVSAEAIRGVRLKRSDLPGIREDGDPFVPETVVEESEPELTPKSTGMRRKKD